MMRSIGNSSEANVPQKVGGATLNLVKIQTGTVPTKSNLKALDGNTSKKEATGEPSRSDNPRKSLGTEDAKPTKQPATSKDRRATKDREASVEGESMTVEELDVKIAEYERQIRRMKNTRDKLKKNTKMLSRQKNEKLDELKVQINDLSNRVQNLEIIKDRKIPAHEKLDKATIFYKHFMKLMYSEQLEETAKERLKEDKDLLKEIGDGIDRIGLFANRTFKAKRFTKDDDGPVEHLRIFVKYYAVFLNSYQGLPLEIQKQFRKVFNELF